MRGAGRPGTGIDFKVRARKYSGLTRGRPEGDIWDPLPNLLVFLVICKSSYSGK